MGLNAWTRDCVSCRFWAARSTQLTPAPRNGTPLKVWDCYPGLFQQTWERKEGKFRLKGTNLCIDVRDGNPKLGLQLWECIEGPHDNQLLILEFPEDYP